MFRRNSPKHEQELLPLKAEVALRDFEKALLEMALPSFATGEVWDDQFQAHYHDPVHKTLLATEARFAQRAEAFRILQKSARGKVEASGVILLDPDAYLKDIGKSARTEAIAYHFKLKERFRELTDDELQDYFRREAEQILWTFSLADAPSYAVDQNSAQHLRNSSTIERFIALVDLFEIACLTHLLMFHPKQPSTEVEDRYPGLRINDQGEVRQRYPLLAQFGELATALQELNQQESQLISQARQMQTQKDAAHALWELYSLHRFPNDVSFRFYEDDHKRSLYPVTSIAVSQRIDVNLDAVLHLVSLVAGNEAPLAQRAFFLETLTYLVISAIVMGARRSRVPAVAAALYGQAVSRGAGLRMLRHAVDKDFADGLSEALKVLDIAYADSHDDTLIEARFRSAQAKIPPRPKFLRSVP